MSGWDRMSAGSEGRLGIWQDGSQRRRSRCLVLVTLGVAPDALGLNLNVGAFVGRTGSAPAPFDAINGPRLAGPQGSHPLHTVLAEELVKAADGPIVGEITLDQPARVGEGITGTIRVTATEQVVARSAALRLVGLRLDEVTRSEDHRDSDGHVTSSDHWVEVHGKLFVEDAFLEPAVPATLEPGREWRAQFAVPAPRLGPPTA